MRCGILYDVSGVKVVVLALEIIEIFFFLLPLFLWMRERNLFLVPASRQTDVHVSVLRKRWLQLPTVAHFV